MHGGWSCGVDESVLFEFPLFFQLGDTTSVAGDTLYALALALQVCEWPQNRAFELSRGAVYPSWMGELSFFTPRSELDK